MVGLFHKGSLLVLLGILAASAAVLTAGALSAQTATEEGIDG